MVQWREPIAIDWLDTGGAVGGAHRPISGPIGRFGPSGLTAVFSLTEVLCLLNPLQVMEMVRQTVGNGRLARRLKRSGDDGGGYRTRVDYSLPFDGEWLVANGGSSPETSHSCDVLGQRYALDFVQADEGLRTHRGRGTRAEDYFCFGREIRAAACGTVVSVEDRVRQGFSRLGAFATSQLAASSGITSWWRMRTGSSGCMRTSSVAAFASGRATRCGAAKCWGAAAIRVTARNRTCISPAGLFGPVWGHEPAGAFFRCCR